jgi:hypothetical protein
MALLSHLSSKQLAVAKEVSTYDHQVEGEKKQQPAVHKCELFFRKKSLKLLLLLFGGHRGN